MGISGFVVFFSRYSEVSLDDLRSTTYSTDELLLLLSNHGAPSYTKSRFFNKLPVFKVLFITSVIDLNQFWKYTKGGHDADDSISQLKRRLTLGYHHVQFFPLPFDEFQALDDVKFFDGLGDLSFSAVCDHPLKDTLITYYKQSISSNISMEVLDALNLNISAHDAQNP